MRPGDRLPTRQALIAAYGVCMVTLQRAMDILRDDGFIVTRGRLGSFVADAPPHLCRYGLVFPCVTTEQQVSGPRLAHLEPPSRFMDAMAQVAMAYADDPAQELICYMAVDRELNTPGYQRLVRDIQARRLAGLIFLHPNSSYTPGLLAGTGIPSIAYGYGHSLPGSPIFQTDHRAFIDRALDFLVAQGRRRIAMLTIAVPGDDMEAHFHQAAAARGLRTGIASVLGLEPQYPWWARNAVALMLNQDPALRPDGLIISDDHLVPSGTHAVLEARIAVPDALMVVAHCNFVSNAPSAVRVTRLGFDVAGILRTCLDRLAAQRRGEPVPPVTRIAPVFAPETDPRPPHKMARRLAHSR
ncbi:MAG TPA: substrate-binding domain-containing protein, partial [Armatimonadota bacterium]|nr:substrate-binding domain-containing protein [Armatimonadota bacterium]